MIKSTIILMLLMSTIKLFGQSSGCNQHVLVKSYLKQLDSTICISDEYLIARIYNEDLDDNLENDRIVKWFSNNLTNGDTIYYSIYLRSESSLKLFGTYSNLSPLYFDMESIDPEVVLEDSVLNEIKSRYVNPQASKVQFNKRGITIEFQLAAREYQKLYFAFYRPRNTFVLTKAEYYVSDRPDGLYLELDRTETFSMEEGLGIEGFDYLDFIYY